MTGDDYLQPPGKAEMERHERAIQISGAAALAMTLGAFAASYFLLPLAIALPTALAERLAFAVQGSVFVLLWVLMAVMMVSTGRRFSPADIGGSAAGPPSPGLAIKAAFLQNTLEQAVLAVGAYLALASLLSGPWLSVIIVSVALFAVGRVLFYLGYRKGAAGRALGMTLTMVPTLLIYLLAVGAMAGRLL